MLKHLLNTNLTEVNIKMLINFSMHNILAFVGKPVIAQHMPEFHSVYVLKAYFKRQCGIMKAKGRVEPCIHSKYNRRLQWQVRCSTTQFLIR